MAVALTSREHRYGRRKNFTPDPDWQLVWRKQRLHQSHKRELLDSDQTANATIIYIYREVMGHDALIPVSSGHPDDNLAPTRGFGAAVTPRNTTHCPMCRQLQP